MVRGTEEHVIYLEPVWVEERVIQGLEGEEVH